MLSMSSNAVNSRKTSSPSTNGSPMDSPPRLALNKERAIRSRLQSTGSRFLDVNFHSFEVRDATLTKFYHHVFLLGGFRKYGGFTSGLGITYEPSAITRLL